MIIPTKKQAKEKSLRYKKRYETAGYIVTIEDTQTAFVATRTKDAFTSSHIFKYKSKLKDCKECGGAFTPDKSKTLCNGCQEEKSNKPDYGRRRLYKCVVCGDKKPEDQVTDHKTEDHKGIFCDLCYRADMDKKDANHNLHKALELHSPMSCGIDQARRFGL